MASSPGKPTLAISLRTVFTKTNKILISNRCHFISLTFLFIFPSSIISTAQYLIHLQSATTPIISIISSAVTLFLYLMAFGTVSFSAHQILLVRHVKLVTSIKSLKCSFFPLLASSLCFMLIVFQIVIGFWYCTVGFGILGFQIAHILDPTSSLNIAVILTTAIVIALLMYFIVNFALSSVIATVEFSYGLESLRRSTYLAKGTRRVILKLMLIYQIITGSALLGIWVSRGDKGDLIEMKNWMFVCGIVMIVVLYTMMTLHYLVAITVLYVNSKGVHGELAGGEVSDDVAGEYISLPFVDGKLEC